MASMIRQLFRLISSFLAWWVTELAGLVPQWLLRLIHPERQLLAVDLENEQLVFWLLRNGQRSKLGQVTLSGRSQEECRSAVANCTGQLKLHQLDVAVRLPPEQILRKHMKLPKATEQDLREALSLQISRQTPFSPEEVYFDHRILAREGDMIEVELFVAPRSTVDDAVARIGDLGLAPTVAGAIERDEPPGNVVNLLAAESTESWRGPRRLVNPLLLLILVGLLAAAAYLPLDRARSRAAALGEQLDQAKAAAEEVLSLKQELDVLRDNSGFLIAAKRAVVPRVKILHEITRLLPDDTWLVQLSIKDTEITINGFSSAASALIGVIDESPLFSTPRFTASVTQDPRLQLERFNLRFKLEGAED